MLGSLVLAVLLCATCVCAHVYDVGFWARLSVGGVSLGDDWTGIMTCSLIAARHFNERNGTVVPKFAELGNCSATINVTMVDTESSPNESVSKYLAMSPKPIAIVGPARSACAVPLSVVSGLDEITLTSYWSTSPDLDDTSTYPYFTRVIPSDAAIADSIAGFFAQYRYTQVAILFPREPYGTALQVAVLESLAKRGIDGSTIGYQIQSQSSIISALKVLRGLQRRIVFCVAWVEDFEFIMTTALSMNVTGPGYLWTFTDTAGMTESTVISAEFAQALHGSAVILSVAGLDTNIHWRTLSESVWPKEDPSLYYPTFQSVVSDNPMTAGFFNRTKIGDLCAFTYDAMAMVGLSLCEIEQAKNGSAAQNGAEMFTAMQGLEFEGPSGTVKLDSVGSRAAETGNFMCLNLLASNTTNGNSVKLNAHRVALWDGVNQEWLFSKDFGFSTGSAKTPVDKCALGHAYNSATFECDACPPGSANNDTSGQCKPCQTGYVAPNSASSSCISCNVWQNSYINTTGGTQCKLCPDLTARIEGTDPISIATCVCQAGAYQASLTAGAPCQSCPDHAKCLGGLALPYPEAGYWRRPDYVAEVFPCPAGEEACLGGPLSECNPGYAANSTVCAKCDDGYFKFGSYCNECTFSAGLQWILVLILMFWFPAQKYLAMHVSKAFYVYYPFLQTLALISTFNLGWSQNVANVMTGLSFVNFNLEITQLSCSGLDFYSTWVAYEVLPWIFVGVFVVLCTLCYFVKREKLMMVLTWSFASWFFYINSLYLMLFGKSLDMLICKDYGPGLRSLKVQPSIECDGIPSKYIGFGWFMVFLSGAGVPIAIAWLLYKHRMSVLHPDMKPLHPLLNGCYFLWRRFEGQYFYWELVVILRKMAMLIILKVFFNDGIVQALLGLVVVYLAGLAQFYARPFVDTKHDLLDSLLSTCQFAILLIGIMFYMDDFSSSMLEAMFFVVLGIAITASAALSVYEIWVFFATRKAVVAATTRVRKMSRASGSGADLAKKGTLESLADAHLAA